MGIVPWKFNTLLQRQHHVSCKNNGNMCCQCIIGKTATLSNQIQVGFAGLEEYFNLPSFSIDSNDLFFGKIRVCADKGNPILLIPIVADTYDFCRNFLVLTDYDFDRKRIFAASSAFLQMPKILLIESCFPSYSERILELFLIIAMALRPRFFAAISCAGVENQVSNRA